MNLKDEEQLGNVETNSETENCETEDALKDNVELEVDVEIIEEPEECEILAIKALEKQNKDLQDRLQRAMAEFDNYRKRTEKEKNSIYSESARATIEKFLPVLDNFERAIQSSENKDDTLYKGVDMIYKQFINIISDLGVEEIECVGMEFDPNLHFAVAHEENDKFEENTVTEVLQKGYTCNGKVLRCSMVKVAN